MTRSLDEIQPMPVPFRDSYGEFRHLRDGGVPQEAALRRIGMSYSGLAQACRRHGVVIEALQ